MKPMTVVEAAIMSKYRNDCSENNRWNRLAWETKRLQANIGDTPDG